LGGRLQENIAAAEAVSGRLHCIGEAETAVA